MLDYNKFGLISAYNGTLYALSIPDFNNFKRHIGIINTTTGVWTSLGDTSSVYNLNGPFCMVGQNSYRAIAQTIAYTSQKYTHFINKPAGSSATQIGPDFEYLPWNDIRVSPSGEMYAIGGTWPGTNSAPSGSLNIYYIKTDNAAGPFADMIPIPLGFIQLPDPGAGRQGISTVRMCFAGSKLEFNGTINDALYCVAGSIKYQTATQTVFGFELSYIEIIRDNYGTPNEARKYVIGMIALDGLATDIAGITVL